MNFVVVRLLVFVFGTVNAAYTMPVMFSTHHFAHNEQHHEAQYQALMGCHFFDCNTAKF
jgi:hypothetical protein